MKLLRETIEWSKPLMDMGYEGMLQAIDLAEDAGIPTQDLPWTAESVLLYVDHHHFEVFGRRSSGMSWDKEVEQILKPTGWTWEKYKHAFDRRDAAQSIEYQLAKSGWLDEHLLRETIRQILTEVEEKELTPEEEVANVMQLYNIPGREEQAMHLAYMLGSKISRHPDLKIWRIISDNPDADLSGVAIEGLNYDQAMDPKYQAFAGLEGGYMTTSEEADGYYHNTGSDASITPPDQDDFDEAEQILNWEKSNIEIINIDEENFEVYVNIDPYDRKQDGDW